MTTRPFVFLGDTLELNADATDGVIVVDALEPSDPTPGAAVPPSTAVFQGNQALTTTLRQKYNSIR